jgi:hypothetical protein
MAIILEFRGVPRRKPASTRAPHRSGNLAEIVLFPGVRYERPVEKANAKPKKSKRRRDTLELQG